MFGRKTYTQAELDHARAAVDEQLMAYRSLVKAVGNVTEDFETTFFNNMTIVLDRYFVHRLRMVTGKDGNALNEVEMVSDSLMNNNGVLQPNNVIKFIPEKSVVKLHIGEPIKVNHDQFERLSAAFLDEIERKFV
jgi:hypothetical protein